MIDLGYCAHLRSDGVPHVGCRALEGRSLAALYLVLFVSITSIILDLQCHNVSNGLQELYVSNGRSR